MKPLTWLLAAWTPLSCAVKQCHHFTTRAHTIPLLSHHPLALLTNIRDVLTHYLTHSHYLTYSHVFAYLSHPTSWKMHLELPKNQPPICSYDIHLWPSLYSFSDYRVQSNFAFFSCLRASVPTISPYNSRNPGGADTWLSHPSIKTRILLPSTTTILLPSTTTVLLMTISLRRRHKNSQKYLHNSKPEFLWLSVDMVRETPD